MSRVARDPAFQARLLFAMERADLDQTALAKKLGTAQPVVWKWVNKAVVPDGRFLLKMPAVLGVSGHWLLTEEGAIEPPGAEQIGPYAQAAALAERRAQLRMAEAVSGAFRSTEGVEGTKPGAAVVVADIDAAKEQAKRVRGRRPRPKRRAAGEG